MPLKSIKAGEKQPAPCRECDMAGYIVSDLLTIYYNTEYSCDGEIEGGAYSEGPEKTKWGKIPYCKNCGKKLNFRLDKP